MKGHVLWLMKDLSAARRLGNMLYAHQYAACMAR